jgi:phosphoenolpyruvate phosphomutase
VPLVSVPTAFPHLDVGQLGVAGFALVIYANQLTRAALVATRAAAAAYAAVLPGAPASPPLAPVQDLLRIGDNSARAAL